MRFWLIEYRRSIALCYLGDPGIRKLDLLLCASRMLTLGCLSYHIRHPTTLLERLNGIDLRLHEKENSLVEPSPTVILTKSIDK